MENSIDIVKEDGLGERQHVDEILELSRKEGVDSNLSGLKESDGDEVFEEAVEAVTPTIDPENRLGFGGNVESTGTLEHSNFISETEKFEEATDVPDAAQDSQLSSSQAEPIMNEEHKVEVQIVAEKVVMDEMDASFVESNLKDRNVEFNEDVDSAPSDIEPGGADDGHVMEELDKSSHDPGDGVPENASSVKNLTAEEDDLKIVDADTGQDVIVELLKSLENSEFETLPEKTDMKTYFHETAEAQDANEVKGGDIGSKKPENGSHHVNLAGTLDDGSIKTGDDNTISEQSEKTSFEVEVASEVNVSEAVSRSESESNGDAMHVVSEAGLRSDSKSNGDVIHSGEKNIILNEPVASPGSGHENKEKTPASQTAELKVDQLEQQEEKSCASAANLKDDENIEPKELDSDSVEFQEVGHQVVEKEENKSVAATDSSATDVNERLHTNVPLIVEDGREILEIAKAEKSNIMSSELLSESSRSSQVELVDASFEVSKASSEVSEKEGVKDEMKEHHVSRGNEQEAGPISTSSGDSSASTTYPPSLPKLHQTVSRDTLSVNEEKKIKPTEGTSFSAKSITTSHPAGLGRTAPLPEPTTQNIVGNKVIGSLSAADVPSSNNTSAAGNTSANITTAAPARPAGLGRAAPLPEPASRVAHQPRVNGAVSPPHNQLIEDHTNGEGEENDETREKLQMIRVKFLRLAHRLGQTPHNVVVAQVLYRLGLAEQLRGRSGGRVAAFSFDRASAMAEQLEAAGQEPLDFTCTIMVLGKSGVGKSATINSIFDEVMFGTDAFQLGTKKVQDIVGTVQGIRVRVIDTPGLLPSWSDQRQNEKILHSVKNFIKKTPPDIVLYLDRLDMQSRDFGDMPLLRTITDTFGPSIWFNAIVVLTHAASAPPEGPNGTATSYDMFVTQRSHVVQQAIRQAAGDMRLMNPVSLVENHSACRTNRAGQRVLPNGQVWKPHLLLLSFASKILAEANTLLKLQDTPPGRPFMPRTRAPPLPFLLSSFLQSRPEIKLPSEQFGDDDEDAIDDDLDESSDSEDDVDYDELPPFKSLTKAQLEKLPKSQRKAYYDELEYREKLFMMKQLKEEKRRRKMMKKMQEAAKDLPAEYGENVEEESTGAASVPVSMPDLTLPASFDSDNPTYRYRSLDSNPWLVRAVLEPNGWDHDIGYDGVNLERLFVVKDKIPISFSGHISKDKKDTNLQMEIASSVKHGKGKATSLGFDMQSVGKDMAYTLRSETRLSNHRMSKAAAGFSATLMGDVLTGGMKVEDKVLIGKRGQLVVSGGGIYGRGDVAYGGSLEATLKDKDHPLGRFLSTLGVSVMDWHGDLAIGCNSQTQIPIGRYSNLIARFNINNRGTGQVSLRVNSSEQLQIVLVGLIPLVKKILASDRSG